MKLKTAAGKKNGTGKGRTSVNGKSVWQEWKYAFDTHGRTGNAPAKIVSHMQKAFPNKDTKWSKWVNGIRARYNRGALAGAAPKTPIPPYKAK